MESLDWLNPRFCLHFLPKRKCTSDNKRQSLPLSVSSREFVPWFVLIVRNGTLPFSVERHYDKKHKSEEHAQNQTCGDRYQNTCNRGNRKLQTIKPHVQVHLRTHLRRNEAKTNAKIYVDVSRHSIGYYVELNENPYMKSMRFRINFRLM